MRTPKLDSELHGKVKALVTDAGIVDGAFERELIEGLVEAALMLGRDGSDLGEIKLMNRSFRELRYALEVFRPYRNRRKVSVFGSARTPIDHPEYEVTRDFSAAMSAKGWMTITGAGEGIMRAGNEGAGKGNSFGLSIRLPFETNANDFIKDDPKYVIFRYFFTRKLLFASQADGVALFPGGFGTMDECFELLTLIQTGKSPIVPIVLVEPPGSRYWIEFQDFIRDFFARKALIHAADLDLFKRFEDPQLAAAYLENFYSNYQKSRIEDDRFVVLHKNPLTTFNLAELNRAHRDMLDQGGFISEPAGTDGLHRLVFHYNRKMSGRMRQLIDHLNHFV